MVTGQTLAQGVDGRGQSWPFAMAKLRSDAEEDDARHPKFLTDRQFAEVLVFGQQDAVFSGGKRNHRRIVGSGGSILHRLHVVTSGAELLYQRSVDAFVGEEAHPRLRSAVDQFFVRKIVSGESLGGADASMVRRG